MAARPPARTRARSGPLRDAVRRRAGRRPPRCRRCCRPVGVFTPLAAIPVLGSVLADHPLTARRSARPARSSGCSGAALVAYRRRGIEPVADRHRLARPAQPRHDRSFVVVHLGRWPPRRARRRRAGRRPSCCATARAPRCARDRRIVVAMAVAAIVLARVTVAALTGRARLSARTVAADAVEVLATPVRPATNLRLRRFVASRDRPQRGPRTRAPRGVSSTVGGPRGRPNPRSRARPRRGGLGVDASAAAGRRSAGAGTAESICRVREHGRDARDECRDVGEVAAVDAQDLDAAAAARSASRRASARRPAGVAWSIAAVELERRAAGATKNQSARYAPASPTTCGTGAGSKQRTIGADVALTVALAPRRATCPPIIEQHPRPGAIACRSSYEIVEEHVAIELSPASRASRARGAASGRRARSRHRTACTRASPGDASRTAPRCVTGRSGRGSVRRRKSTPCRRPVRAVPGSRRRRRRRTRRRRGDRARRDP